MPRKQQMPNKSSLSACTKGQSSTLHTFQDSLQGSGYYKAVSNLVLRSAVQKDGFQKLIHTSPPADVRPVKMVGLHPIHYDSVGLGICFFNKLHKDSAFQASLWTLGLDLREDRDQVSLVPQWSPLLPSQEMQFLSIVWEDSSVYGPTKPVCHNYWACALELGRCNY